MYDYTNRVKKVINEFAPREAKRLGHEFYGPEHILLGLLRATDSVAVKILQNLNIDLSELQAEIERRAEQSGVTLLIDPTSKDRVQKVLDYSREEARKLRHSYVGSEHILLALLRDSGSVAASALSAFSITYQVIRNELNQTLGMTKADASARDTAKSAPSARKTPMLDEFARNLTKMAMDQKMDPVIGREKEVERVIQILSRKSKNNPVLVGEAGVGKTAIVEGLAQRILQKQVPESLFQKVVYALDVAAMIAGTKYRGEFEDRIKKIMKEVKTNSNVILFIDELHTIIGAGAAEGAMDAANILKPALARGEIQCIGATTLKEYKKYIERDTALERRFQTVMVEEPSLEDAIRILSGLRKSYEKHHGVQYTKESIKAAVTLSDRFITDRYLPDKAIDVIDEAGAKARLKNSVIPDEFKEMELEITKLIREKNEKVRLQEYEKAAQFRDRIVRLESELGEKMTAWRKEQKEKEILIREEDINSVIYDWTGIPMHQMNEGETEKLKYMESQLSEEIIGQKQAIEKISRAVRRARTGFKSPKRPTGSFIFLGPTGVGKTQLTKVLAKYIFGDEKSMIRFDMSEYMELHSVSKFIGSPPGYVGYDEGGQLTEAVRRHPYSILLFDEIEKAHPDIQNILLQVLDEGELTDNTGNHIDFKETIIIMTSNLGARELMKGGRLGFNEAGEKKESRNDQVLEELKNHFRPEFLNRVDDVIVFEPLDQEQIGQVVDILLEEINRNVIRKDLHLKLTKAGREYFAKHGYDEKLGARPLKRLLQKEVEDELASFVIDGKIEGPTQVSISARNDKVTFQFRKLSPDKLEKLKEKYLVAEESIEQWWDDEKADEEEKTPEVAGHS